MPLILLLFSFIFGAGAAGLQTGLSGQTYPVKTITTASCYQVEDGTTVTVNGGSLTSADCQAQIDSKTYVRVRQKVKIVNAKIQEGASYTGNCVNGPSKLRKVGTTNDGKEVWWLDKNHLNDDTSSFILIFLEKKDTDYVFDVYIDQAEKDKLATDPKYEFVRNCKETGGLVPVVEGPATPAFPPQVISLNNDPKLTYQVFTPSDFFNDFKSEYAPWYIRIEEKQKPDAAKKIGSLKVTISGQTKNYEVFYHAAIVYLIDLVDNKSFIYNPSQEEPPFEKPRNPTLQLTALKFITTSEWTWATPECKPALYLYPEKPTKLKIWLNPAGKLTVTDPPYEPKTGWEVLAFPDGTLLSGNALSHPEFISGSLTKGFRNKFGMTSGIQSYRYLYYEAEIEKVKVPKEGWMVKKEELEEFFDKTLPVLGLNRNETDEFKNYWLSVLNAAPYYFVGLIPYQEIERIEPISFSQKPDNFIRLRFFFEPLERPVLAAEPKLPSISKRFGFTAVDWGGILSSGSCQDGQVKNPKVR